MATTVTLNFPNEINVSIQANGTAPYDGADIVYFKSAIDDKIYKFGPCIASTSTTVSCWVENYTPRPTSNDFIFFAKSPETNTSGIIGYYADVDMESESTSKEELFAVNSEIFISSNNV